MRAVGKHWQDLADATVALVSGSVVVERAPSIVVEHLVPCAGRREAD